MKRRKIIYCGVLFLLFACAGCQKARQPEPSGEAAKPSGEGGWKEIPKITVPLEEQGTVQPDEKESQSNASDAGLLLKGEVLTGLVRVGEDAPYYCTTEENMRFAYVQANRCNMVCKDPVYGITYYINYGEDYYIYALVDGQSVPAVKLPAKEIYCRDGLVYFIALSPGKKEYSAMDSGKIMSYDPLTGELLTVTEQEANRFLVYPDGMYLQYLTGEMWVALYGEENIKNYQFYYYSFADKTVRESDAKSIERMRGRSVVPVVGELPEDSHGRLQNPVVKMGITGYEFTDEEDGKKEAWSVLPYDHNVYSFFRVSGDMAYCLEQDFVPDTGWEAGDGIPEEWHIITAYHLDTGEREELCRLSNMLYSEMLSDFIVFGDGIYFAKGTRVDRTDGSCSRIGGLREEGTLFFGEEAWYTDGENLFYYSGKRLYLCRETKREKTLTLTHPTDKGEKTVASDYSMELVPLGTKPEEK